MVKTFYVQIDMENIVRDIISFEHEDYIEITTNIPLPPKVMAGCYRLLNNEIIYVESLDTDLQHQKIDELQAKLDYLAVMTGNEEVL